MTAQRKPTSFPPTAASLVDRIVPPPRPKALRGTGLALPALVLDAAGAGRPRADRHRRREPAHGLPRRRRLRERRRAPAARRRHRVAAALHPGGRGRARAALERARDAALFDDRGRLWGSDRRSTRSSSAIRSHESRHVYGTEDPSPPGRRLPALAAALARGRPGPGAAAPRGPSLRRAPPDPAGAARSGSPSCGWQRVAGFQTRNPIHRAHEHLTKLALEFADGLVIHPLVGETKNDDVPAAVRFQAYEALVETVLPARPHAPRRVPGGHALRGSAGGALPRPRAEELRHHAPDRGPRPRGRREVLRTLRGPGDLRPVHRRRARASTPLKFEPTFFCRACDALASPRTCPHDAASRLELSGTKVREILRSGGRLPAEFTRPEIAEILREHYAGGGPSAVSAAASRQGRVHRVVHGPLGRGQEHAGRGAARHAWRTAGASRSSTATRCAPTSRRASASPRRTATPTSGASASWRGSWPGTASAVITAAISPYAATRDEVRAPAEAEGIPFVEVFVQAELEALVARDVKGLYKKALAGEIAHFTGVSDPYEAPGEPRRDRPERPGDRGGEPRPHPGGARGARAARSEPLARPRVVSAAPLLPAFLKLDGQAGAGRGRRPGGRGEARRPAGRGRRRHRRGARSRGPRSSAAGVRVQRRAFEPSRPRRRLARGRGGARPT